MAERFGLAWPEPPSVKIADKAARVTEQRDVRVAPEGGYVASCEPWPEQIVAWDVSRSRMEFFRRFNELVRADR